MTHLPVHPYTGLTALGLRRDGRPIWPVLGGSEPSADPDPAPPADPSPGGPSPQEPLGDAGKAALAAERTARKAAEKELAAYRKAEQDRADADKTEAEKRAAAEQRAADAELRALRLEVAAEKGLNATQAKRLMGATRDELLADADEILAAFPAGGTTPPPKPPPAPDPSQGGRGTPPAARPTSLGQAVGAALNRKA